MKYIYIILDSQLDLYNFFRITDIEVHVRFFLLLNRYHDLYYELGRQGVAESLVRLILINEEQAANNYPANANANNSIRLVQDNSNDRLVKKLSLRGPTMNNYVFGR